MKDKLELKHLACYLPYRLKVTWQNIENKQVKETMIGSTMYNLSGTPIEEVLDTDMCIKPILRPLSDLTKELLSEYYNDLMDVDLERVIKDTLEWPKNQSYTFTQQLFKWHFDVFGLIDKGLAIDINKVGGL